MEATILNKARERFFTLGLKRVSMDDLARSAGTSKKTLYQYYPDKHQLVEKVVDDLIACHKERFDMSRKKAVNAVDEVWLQSQLPFETWSSVLPHFFHDIEKYYPSSWQKLQAHKESVLLKGIRANLEWGMKEGLYRADIDPRFIADLRLEQLVNMLQTGPGNSRFITIGRRMEAVTRFYLHGITTEKGKKLLNTYLMIKNEN